MKVEIKKVSAERNALNAHYISTKHTVRHTGYQILAPVGSDAGCTMVCGCSHQRYHKSECLHVQAARELLRAEAAVEQAEGMVNVGNAAYDGDDLLFAVA